MKCTDCHRVLAPVVAVDLDGTLGDYHKHLRAFCERYFGRFLPDGWDGTGDWEDFLGLTRAEYREAKLAFRQGGEKRTMPVFPGATDLITAISEAGAEVWITTTRPWMRHDATDPDTREWLRRNGFSYDHLLYDDAKYAKLGTIVDPMRVVSILDDLPEQVTRAELLYGADTAMMARRQHNLAYRSQAQLWGYRAVTLDEAQHLIISRVERWYSRYGDQGRSEQSLPGADQSARTPGLSVRP